MLVSKPPIAILLMAVGGPGCLDDVEPFLLDIRGGRPTSPELIEEIRERYRATGEKSPVPGIMKEVARELEGRLNGSGSERVRVFIGFRHWHPSIKATYEAILQHRPQRLIGVCMAPQYSVLSVGAYTKKVEEARDMAGGDFPVTFVESWYRHPLLIKGITDNILRGLDAFPPQVRPSVPILFTAHSLPERILKDNDPYPAEVRGTVDAVCEQFGSVLWRFAFQSQGRTDETWLGPTVEETLAQLHQEGHRHVLIAPIGFLSDHLEVLYDVDIELKQLAESKGMQLERMPMLNATPPFIDTLASVVEEHLASLVVSSTPS